MTQATPRRVEVSFVEHNKTNGKWSVHFDERRSAEDDTIVARVSSAALFDDQAAAYSAGARAIAQLLCRGQYPNMCELF